MIMEALLKIGIEIALKRVIDFVRKHPLTVLMGILSAMRHIRWL